MLPEAVSASRLIFVLFIITLLLGAVYFIAVWGRRRVVASLTGHRREPPLLAGKVPLLALLLEPTKHPWALFWAATRPQKWLVVAWIVVLAIFIFSLVNPAFVADWLPRALFLPVLTGAGVLLLGEVAALSHRWETPLLLVLAVAGGLSAWLLGHYNDVRWAKQPAQSNVVGASLEISFADALARWKYANNCDQGQTCRDPIVIAGAGGASRAAFQTATVAGALIDLGLKEPGTYGNLRNRIFALSTVSGSSVGAVRDARCANRRGQNGMRTNRPARTLFRRLVRKRRQPRRELVIQRQRILARLFPAVVGGRLPVCGGGWARLSRQLPARKSIHRARVLVGSRRPARASFRASLLRRHRERRSCMHRRED